MKSGSQSGFCLEFTCFNESPVSALKFLLSRLVDAHAELLDDLFISGHVLCNGRQVDAFGLCAEGDRLSVILPDHEEGEVDTGWRTLWQNDALMAVYKPHSLPVSRTTRNLYNTLVSLVRRETPYSDARLLHRLDTETAGIMLLAKNASADRYWKARINELIVEKLYHARVHGVPEWQSRYLSCQLSEKQESAIRSQVYVVDPTCPEMYKNPKQSRTLFRVIECAENDALIECRLLTGRKHQIRAQLAWLGHPIVGDKVYSNQGRYYLKRIESGLNQADLQDLGSPFHCLAAVSLLLSIDGQEIRLSLS